jgi:hypothetical protein
MSVVNEWCVAIFKCKAEQIKRAMLELYHFVSGLEGVKSLHFLVRDRVDDETVFSFRVMVELKKKNILKSKIAYKLGTLFSSDKFAVDPDSSSPLQQYIAWDVERRIADSGLRKLDDFTYFLSSMSKLVLEMIEKEYFASKDRVELAHVMAWMLGCTEYGVLSTKAMEIGYYDRIEDKYCAYLKQEFPTVQTKD